MRRKDRISGSGAGRAAVLAASLVLAAGAVPANASVNQGYISGFDTVTDDWGDEGELARNTFPNSNASGLWQLVLYADGYLGAGEVDCEFGPRTEAATKRWQGDRQLRADGRVGVNTFSRADNNLRITADPLIVEYDGSYASVYFRREQGVYYIYPSVPAYYRVKSSLC